MIHPNTLHRRNTGSRLPAGALALAALLLAAVAPASAQQYSAQQYKELLNRYVQSDNDAAMRAFTQGRSFVDAQQWAQAASTFDRFVTQYPKDKNYDAALYWLAYAHNRQGNPQAAEAPLARPAHIALEAVRRAAHARERQRVERGALARPLVRRERVPAQRAEAPGEEDVALDEPLLGRAAHVAGDGGGRLRDRGLVRDRGLSDCGGGGGRRDGARGAGGTQGTQAHSLCPSKAARRRHATGARRRWPVVDCGPYGASHAAC